MLRTNLAIAAVVLLPSALILLGCGKSTTSSTAPQPTAQAPQLDATHDHADSTPQTGHEAEITAALAKLTAEDRALATKQQICPVSGEPLGSMGAPVKIDVKGQPVFICCEGCRDKLLATPDEYLAKLHK